MSIDIVVAVTTRGGIASNGDLIHHVSQDLRRFREKTENQWCIMGEKTFRSLPKPFANGRTNVIVTRQDNYKVDPHLLNKYDILVEGSLDKIINHYRSGENDRRLCICGGGEIYRQAIIHADRVFLTLFHDDTDDFDVDFPLEYLEKHFEILHKEEHEDENGLRFDFIDYVRKENVDGE